MKGKSLIFYFILTFIIVFIVSTGVSVLYNLIFHGKGIAEFETGFRLATILSFVLTFDRLLKKR